MKVHVVTNELGKVIATAQFPQETNADTPFGARVTPLPGQTVHELDLPQEICTLRSHEDISRLHNECGKLLAKAKGKSKGKDKRKKKRKV